MSYGDVANDEYLNKCESCERDVFAVVRVYVYECSGRTDRHTWPASPQNRVQTTNHWKCARFFELPRMDMRPGILLAHHSIGIPESAFFFHSFTNVLISFSLRHRIKDNLRLFSASAQIEKMFERALIKPCVRCAALFHECKIIKHTMTACHSVPHDLTYIPR